MNGWMDELDEAHWNLTFHLKTAGGSASFPSNVLNMLTVLKEKNADAVK